MRRPEFLGRNVRVRDLRKNLSCSWKFLVFQHVQSKCSAHVPCDVIDNSSVQLQLAVAPRRRDCARWLAGWLEQARSIDCTALQTLQWRLEVPLHCVTLAPSFEGWLRNRSPTFFRRELHRSSPCDFWEGLLGCVAVSAEPFTLLCQCYHVKLSCSVCCSIPACNGAGLSGLRRRLHSNKCLRNWLSLWWKRCPRHTKW